MSTRDLTPTKRLTRSMSLAGILAILLGSLTLVLATSTAADAATQYGYAKPTQKEAYLMYYVSRGDQILDVDKAHATSAGFYFAEKNSAVPRGFSWRYQPFGMWCGGDTAKVAFNPWMNSYWCVPNDAAIAKQFPAAAQNTAACVASTGYPWKQGSPFQGGTGCSDARIDWSADAALQPTSTSSACAPWEPDPCDSTHYDWESATPNSFWVPAPDSCTQMPANTNKHTPAYDPADYAPASGGDGSCTGAALPPNCPIASDGSIDPTQPGGTNEACTGVPEPVSSTVVTPTTYTATATVSSTQSATVTVTKSVTSKQNVLRFTSTQKVVKRWHHRRFVGKGVKRLYKAASRTGRASVKASSSASSSASASCTASTLAAAQACARTAASRTAASRAKTAASTRARSAATTRANSVARTRSITAARSAAKHVKVGPAAKRRVVKAAKRLATQRANAKVRAAKRHH